MTKISFTIREDVVKTYEITIPDMDAFKKELSELIKQEGTISFWNLDDDLSEVCTYEIVDEDVEYDEDDFYEKMEKNGLPTDEDELEKYSQETETTFN